MEEDTTILLRFLKKELMFTCCCIRYKNKYSKNVTVTVQYNSKSVESAVMLINHY